MPSMKTVLPKPHHWQRQSRCSRKVRHLTCFRADMFPIMREEECARWKLGCCLSERAVLKRNTGVEGKVIPCMLRLIKYVAQRKCALFKSVARHYLAAEDEVLKVPMVRWGKNYMCCFVNIWRGEDFLQVGLFIWPSPFWECQLIFYNPSAPPLSLKPLCFKYWRWIIVFRVLLSSGRKPGDREECT